MKKISVMRAAYEKYLRDDDTLPIPLLTPSTACYVVDDEATEQRVLDRLLVHAGDPDVDVSIQRVRHNRGHR